MTNSQRRGALLGIVGGLIGSAVVFGILGKKDVTPADKYRTEKVTRGDVSMIVTATGAVAPVTTVQIGSQVSGVIARLYADFNSRVTKGQLLAELDPTPIQAQVEQRRADVAKADVAVRNAALNLSRQKRLAAAGLAAQADLDTARAAHDSARAELAQSQAAVRQTETNLAYTKIYSPVEGIVIDRQYDVGQTVAASFQAPTLFTIAQDLTKMQVQADVDESDIGRIKVGQPSRFSVDAYPDEEFVGRISQLRLNATVNQNVVTYPVIIEVPNPGERLRPKMTANVTIEVSSVQNVLRVPNAALRFRPEEVEGAAGARGSRTGPAGDRPGSDRARGDGAGRSETAGRGAEGFERSAARMGDRQAGAGGAARVLGESRRRGGPSGQAAYVLDEAAKLKRVQIRTGISDGRFTQVLEGQLREGDEVVTGMATARGAQTGQRAPGMGGPGAPGGGGGRGRF